MPNPVNTACTSTQGLSRRLQIGFCKAPVFLTDSLNQADWALWPNSLKQFGLASTHRHVYCAASVVLYEPLSALLRTPCPTDIRILRRRGNSFSFRITDGSSRRVTVSSWPGHVKKLEEGMNGNFSFVNEYNKAPHSSLGARFRCLVDLEGLNQAADSAPSLEARGPETGIP